MGEIIAEAVYVKAPRAQLGQTKKRLRASGQFIGYGTHVGRQFKREGIWAGRHSTQHNKKEDSKRMKIRRWRTTKLENQDLDNIEEKKKF